MAKKKSIRRTEPMKDVDLFTEELEETLVMSEAASSGFTEERDVDKRIERIDEEKERKGLMKAPKRKKRKRRG